MQAHTAGDKVLILVPFKQHINRSPTEEMNILLQKGFSRLYVNQEILRIEDLLPTPTQLNPKRPNPNFRKTIPSS